MSPWRQSVRDWSVIFVIAVLIVWLMSGCQTMEGPTTLPQAKVPVLIPCNPPAIAAPAWPLDALPADYTPFEWARALYAEWELRKGYELQLETAANSCRSDATAARTNAVPVAAMPSAPEAKPAAPNVLDRLKGLFGTAR